MDCYLKILNIHRGLERTPEEAEPEPSKPKTLTSELAEAAEP